MTSTGIFRGEPFRRNVLPASTTAALQTGLYAAAGLPGTLAPEHIHWLGQANGQDRQRSARLRFAARGASGPGGNNEAVAFRVAAVRLGQEAGKSARRSDTYDVEMVCEFTATTATGVNPSADLFDADDTLCDTIASLTEATASTTRKGAFNAWRTAFGGPSLTAYSPGDNANAAELIIPDAFGAAGLLIEGTHASLIPVVYAELLT